MSQATCRPYPWQVLLGSCVVVVSIVVASATGLLLWAHVVFPSPEDWEYGLPLPWRDVLRYGYPRPDINMWDWFLFSLDALFYMAVGYLLVIPYQRRQRTKPIVSRSVVLSVAYVVLVLLISAWPHMTYCDPAFRQCG